MKPNFIHVCFIIDESGSMYSSTSDVIGGFKKIIDDQKAEKDGTCAISLYKFNDSVKKVYIGKDINDVAPLQEGHNNYWSMLSRKISSVFSDTDTKTIEQEDTLNVAEDPDAVYSPEGSTAMFDGICTAIDEIGVWLANMEEDERPSKNLIVIMTDGQENSSIKFDEQNTKQRITHQEDVYSWTFMYMGTDITTKSYATNLGIKIQSYSDRAELSKNYDVVNNATKMFRKSTKSLDAATMDMCTYLNDEAELTTSKYMTKVGQF